MKNILVWACLLIGFGLLSACTANAETAQTEQPFDWRDDWAVADGFALEIDSEGFNQPTAIAFVPEPGDGPDDPLYFVTELKGQVKVVTNDRTVYTFAENFVQFEPVAEIPDLEGQSGAAGICLEPEKGYVFVTTVYQDESNILRNNIVRFQTEPGTFSLEPSDQIDFRDVFSDHRAGPSHQVGPCQIHDDYMYVSVGDAYHSPINSQKIESLNGKVLRMTLDGEPLEDNPFFIDDDETSAEDFVWSYGHRNPFSSSLVNDRLFVFDNGPEIDRFLEVQKGVNYLWDGSDRSMSTNAVAVFSPSLGPVQMDFNDNPDLFPEAYQDNFFVALSGRDLGVLMLEYDFEQHQMNAVPDHVLRYRGESDQWVIGLAMGPDGLYYSLLAPDEEGRNYIIKMVYDPEVGHPHKLTNNVSEGYLFYSKGCLGCHQRENRGPAVSIGPPLNTEGLMSRLDQRLNSDAYEASLQQTDLLDPEYQAARDEVLAVTGEDRVRTWVKYRLMEPRFDNVYSQMPNLGLSEDEAETITNFLLEPKSNDPASRVTRLIERYVSLELLPMILGAFLVGVLFVVVLFLLGYGLMKFKRSRQS